LNTLLQEALYDKQLLKECNLQQAKQEIQDHELHFAHEEVRTYKTILKAAMDQSTVGFAIADAPSGRLRYVNDAGLCIRGSDRESVVNGIGIDQYVSSWQMRDFDGRPLSTEEVPLTRAIRYGETCSKEFVISRGDGDNRIVIANASPIKDEAGNILAAIVFFTDITARKQVETYKDLAREVLQILNEPENLHDSVQHVLSVMKSRMEFDAVGLRLQEGKDYPYFAHNGFTEDFLLKENSLIGRSADGGICRDKDGNVCLECTCGLVISGSTDVNNPLFTPGGSIWSNDSFPLLEIPPDDDPRFHPRNECIHHGYASVALVPIRSKGKIIGLIQFNDQRKGRLTLETVELMEDMASHIGAALMRKQAEEYQSRLEAQLQQAQKMESVGRLAGGVAHDFNNKLTIILGRAQLTLMDLDENHQHYANIDSIRLAAEQSASLTRQLLAFARKQIISPKVLDLGVTVQGMVKMLRYLIGEDIQLVYHPMPNLWPVNVDAAQIDQILANLCVNARDAIKNVGTICIEIENCAIDEDFCDTCKGPEPGDYLRLVVSDDGCGMDTETKKQIFEPFFTTKAIGEGTGLGLATVYGIIKQNNGFIDVISEPGVGTTFLIYLPRHSGETLRPQTKEDSEVLPRGREVILLVEDEPDILKMISVILQGLGYTVLATHSPVEALNIASEHADQIHLLLTDVVMPEMNGRDLVDYILVNNPQLKHLFMSGYTSDIIARHEVLDDGVHFICKPFQLPDLAYKLREILDAQ